jgi:hypothetical protein
MYFEILFLEEPVPRHFLGESQKACYARITIAEFSERIIVPLDFWSQENYRAQWIDGVSRLVVGRREVSALYTEVYNFNHSHFAPVCWLLYREGETVYVQNKWLPRETLPHDFNPLEGYKSLPPRETRTPEGDQISEWITNINALATWRSKLMAVDDSPKADYPRA